jgi:predicted nucleic acid-binding protein
VGQEDEFHRLGRLQETMLALLRDDHHDEALAIWDDLDDRERRMLFTALASMVNHLRRERGDSPDATYGPPETRGL